MAISVAEKAAQIMEHLCSHNAHGYSQPNRAGVGTGGGKGETITLSDGSTVQISIGDRDCSSAAIECYAAQGIDCGGAYYTGDMVQKMVATGNFKKLPRSEWRNSLRGDLLVKQGVHVAMALGGGKLGEAAISETGGIHGQVGDQTGREIRVTNLYDDGWDCVLRCTVKNKKKMSDAGIADVPTQTYTGKEIKPTLSSSAGATFNTSYKDNVNVGYGSATVTGTGDWEGSVTKQFKILPKSLAGFSDVDPTAWYVNSLDKAVSAGYLNGYNNGCIGPNDTLTRGQACCLFANAEKVDLDSAFSDVVASPYYYEAVQWAEDADIVNGDGGKFRPDDPCTRCEFVSMLHNLAGNPEPKGEPAGYQDWNDVPDWGKNSMAWSVEKGIVSGNSGKLRPNDVCTRAEAAAMLVSFYKI